MDLSIVIVTHNNFSNKYGCIENVITNLLKQKDINFEVIIVDNSSDNYDIQMLKKLQSKYEKLVVSYSDVNNISCGRNIGAKLAKSNLILFMDDDIILIDDSTLYDVYKMAQQSSYGYSATRLWTSEGWYEKNKLNFDELIQEKDEIMRKRLTLPDPRIRNKKNVRHLARTYVGNFGFIRKDVLESIGFWDETYKGYGLEDDDMALKLYINYGLPKILHEIEVIHISHPIKKTNYAELEKNKLIFNEKLKKYGIKIFHIGRLMYEESDILEKY